eukprot:3868565-Prymnesium_polylepis.1
MADAGHSPSQIPIERSFVRAEMGLVKHAAAPAIHPEIPRPAGCLVAQRLEASGSLGRGALLKRHEREDARLIVLASRPVRAVREEPSRLETVTIRVWPAWELVQPHSALLCLDSVGVRHVLRARAQSARMLIPRAEVPRLLRRVFPRGALADALLCALERHCHTKERGATGVRAAAIRVPAQLHILDDRPREPTAEEGIVYQGHVDVAENDGVLLHHKDEWRPDHAGGIEQECAEQPCLVLPSGRAGDVVVEL